MTKSTHDGGIPVLTEIIPSPAPNGAAKHEAANAPKTAEPEPVATAATSTLVDLAKEELRRLERDISERVLQQMLGRIDFVLEQRVRDSLADVLQTAVEGLAEEIRFGLQQTLEEVINRAVSQEIAHLHTTKE